jgi:hypothetical protein
MWVSFFKISIDPWLSQHKQSNKKMKQNSNSNYLDRLMG